MTEYRETLPREVVFEEAVLSKEIVGRTLADDVYNKNGVLLLPRENVLTEGNIQRLQQFEVQKVFLTIAKKSA